MARSTRIRDSVFVRHGWHNKRECMRPDFDVGNGRFNLWHVARDALAAWRSGLVMRVFLKGRGAWPIQ